MFCIMQAVWMLEYIINKHSSDLSQLYMMYDIACTLSHHIKASLLHSIVS